MTSRKRREALKAGVEVAMMTIRMSEEDFRDECNSDGGVCLDCGTPTTGVEPDARRYQCESCGRDAVYGLEEALLMGQIVIT